MRFGKAQMTKDEAFAKLARSKFRSRFKLSYPPRNLFRGQPKAERTISPTSSVSVLRRSVAMRRTSCGRSSALPSRRTTASRRRCEMRRRTKFGGKVAKRRRSRPQGPAASDLQGDARLGDVLPWLHGEVVEGKARHSAYGCAEGEGRRFPDGVGRATDGRLTAVV